MARFDSFDVETGESTLSVTLALPDRASPAPAVLLVAGFPGARQAEAPLLADLTGQLPSDGFVVAQPEPSPGSGPAGDLSELIDQAAAAYRALRLRDEVDEDRVCVVGIGLGCVPVAGLARRAESIARLALINGVTAADLADRTARAEDADAPGPVDPAAAGGSLLASLAAARSEDDAAFHDRPTLILHAAADAGNPPTGSRPYREAIERVGHHAQYELVARAATAFPDESVRHAVVARLRDFLRETGPWPAVTADPADVSE